MIVLRALVALAVIGSAAAAAYGLLIDRSGAQIAITTAALVVLGISTLVAGLLLGGSGIGAGRQGRGGAGCVLALAGGICLLVAAAALAGAIILGTIVATS